jgi:integrase
MAKPIKRGKVWGVQISVGGVRESATFPTAREANDWQIRRKVELKAERRGRGGEVHSLGEALRKYRDEVSPKKKGARWEQLRIERMLRELPVTLPLAEIGPDHLIAWRDMRLTRVKPASVAREMNLLGSVFSYAVREWRWIKTSPMSEVTRPRGGKHREKVINRGETRRMLRALGYRPRRRLTTLKQVVAAAFLLSMRTGMRSSEMVDLTWGRVHPRFVRLDETKNADARDVPLSTAARRLVDRMRGLDEDRVFPVSHQSRDALFRAARDEHGLRECGFTFHDARHTAATRIGATVGQPGRLSFPEFVKVFGWRDPKNALIYVNPSAAILADKL